MLYIYRSADKNISIWINLMFNFLTFIYNKLFTFINNTFSCSQLYTNNRYQ